MLAAGKKRTTFFMSGFVLNSPQPIRCFGHDPDLGYGLVWPTDRELAFVARPGLTSLVIS